MLRTNAHPVDIFEGAERMKRENAVFPAIKCILSRKDSALSIVKFSFTLTVFKINVHYPSNTKRKDFATIRITKVLPT